MSSGKRINLGSDSDGEEEDWKLHKKIINFKPIYSHTGDDIARSIIECLRECGIKTVMCITLDNVSSNTVAMDYLRDRVENLFFNGTYLHIKCTAHILNLIVQEGLKQYIGPIEKIRAAVKYIRNSPKRCHEFKACVDFLSIESKSMLRLDCPTRWNSTYDMLATTVKLEKAFNEYENRNVSYKFGLGNMAPSRIDWILIGKIVSFLQIFKRKTELVSANLSVNANYFLSEVVDLNMQLLKFNQHDDYEYKAMIAAMRDKFNKYWDNIAKFNLMTYFATIFDPRMKMYVVINGYTMIYKWLRKPNVKETEDEVVEKIKNKVGEEVGNPLETLFQYYIGKFGIPILNEQNECDNQVNIHDDGDNEFLRDITNSGSSSVSDTKTELQKYLQEPREPGLGRQDFDILNWWKVNTPRFPILANMARDILAIQISTVASESAFSTSGRVLDAFRSSLSTDNVQALICTQDWIKNPRKNVTEIDEEDLEDFKDINKDILEKIVEMEDVEKLDD